MISWLEREGQTFRRVPSDLSVTHKKERKKLTHAIRKKCQNYLHTRVRGLSPARRGCDRTVLRLSTCLDSWLGLIHHTFGHRYGYRCYEETFMNHIDASCMPELMREKFRICDRRKIVRFLRTFFSRGAQ